MAEPRVSITQKELNTLRDSVQALTAENEELKRKLERMNELLLNAQRTRFGQSSEKRVNIPAPGNRQSGDLEITNPAYWKSSFRSAGNHYTGIPVGGNRRPGKTGTGIPAKWVPQIRRNGNRCRAAEMV